MNDIIEHEESNKESQPKSAFDVAQKIINKSYYLEQQDLLKNLVLIIAEERIKMNSFDFYKIWDIVRGWMPVHILKTLYSEIKPGKIFKQPCTLSINMKIFYKWSKTVL